MRTIASKGLAGTALGIGIGGLALALLNGNGRGVFGSLGGCNMPENVNINAYGANASSNQPTALQVMEKECDDEVKLITDMFGLKLDSANKFYAMRETDIAEKFSMYKGAGHTKPRPETLTLYPPLTRVDFVPIRFFSFTGSLVLTRETSCEVTR